MNNLDRKISHFLTHLREELKDCEEIYGEEDSGSLGGYYTTFQKSGKAFDFGQFYYKKRVSPIIKNIKKGVKILDAGCGVGTETILFSSFGAKVTGVDIRGGRIETAKKRIKYFEKTLNTPLEIQFKHENILKHVGKYDIIWANEAVSHINPLPTFLNMCHQNLNKNGILIIVDANKSNPIVYYNSKLEQKKYGGLITFLDEKDPKTKEKVSYAVERVFNIPSIKSILSNLFDVKEVNSFGYIPFSLFKLYPPLFKKIENQLSKIPLINYFSGIYSLICIKK